jgi:hypothetical protein
MRTNRKHNGKGECFMTDFLRDVAAFASIMTFIASLGILVMAM